MRNGYKVCYREKGGTKYIRYFITNKYKDAKYIILGFKHYPPTERGTNRVLNMPKYKVKKISRKEIQAGIWREVPF